MILNFPYQIPKQQSYLIVLGIILLGLWFVFMVSLSKSEKSDYGEIKDKICNYQDINPDELALMIDLLLKSEDRRFTEIDDIRDFLCNNHKDMLFPDKKHLARLLGTSDIHKVKEEVKKLASRWMKKINTTNPNIGINKKTKNLVLEHPDTKKRIETNIPFDTFVIKK